MRLIIFAGFLGSGKTTLLLEIARKLTADSRRIAIIENEVGEIGIDGMYLEMEGLQVKELFGGCICCTLSVGLIETLENIRKINDPDTVIIEATGVARPGDIVRSVRTYQPNVDDIHVITIIDAVRFEMLIYMTEPLMTAQIEAADIVAVNKVDEVNKEEVDKIIRKVRRLNGVAMVIPIAAEEKINLDHILEELT